MRWATIAPVVQLTVQPSVVRDVGVRVDRVCGFALWMMGMLAEHSEVSYDQCHSLHDTECCVAQSGRFPYNTRQRNKVSALVRVIKHDASTQHLYVGYMLHSHL